MKKVVFISIFGIIIFALSCEKQNISVNQDTNVYQDTIVNQDTIVIEDTTTYLDKWVGNYEGNSRHWYSYSYFVDGEWHTHNEANYKKVVVNVQKGSKELCLNFKITYDDIEKDSIINLLFPESGDFIQYIDGGSSYGKIEINFTNDILSYDYSRGCGHYCSKGIDFKIEKR